MKKLISLLICFALLFLVFAMPNITAENAPAIVVDSVTAKKGETVTVNISLQNNPGIVSMTLKVTYDSTVLTLTNVQDGGILGTQSHKPQYSSPYTLAWVNDTATTNFTANGVIVSLEFTVDESAEISEEYPVTVSYDADNYDIYNKDVEVVDFAIVNGLVKISAESIEPTPTPLSDFSYRIENGNICITGYNGSDTEIFIAETYELSGQEKAVTIIDESAFEGDEEITSVILPATIEAIYDYAFYDCTSLTDVTLFGKYTEIGEKAFGYYYISRKLDGKVENFTLTAYSGGTAEEYIAENGMSFNALTKPFAKGDISVNGELDYSDLLCLKDHLIEIVSLNESLLYFADVNDDGLCDLRDLVRIKKVICNMQ